MQSKGLFQQFVVTLVAIGVALLAYYYFRQPQVEAARKQTAELADQAQELGEQATALKEQVAEEHRKAAQRKEKFLIASYRAEGLQAASSAKLAIIEHYFSTGKLASSNAQIGLPAPDEFRRQSLRNMAISAGGVIILTYDAKSGIEGGIIELRPDFSNAYNVQWHCVSPDFREIAETMPQCSYQGQDGSATGAG